MGGVIFDLVCSCRCGDLMLVNYLAAARLPVFFLYFRKLSGYALFQLQLIGKRFFDLCYLLLQIVDILYAVENIFAV